MKRKEPIRVDIRPMCQKVVVNEHGRSTHPAQAFHLEGVLAKIIFERNDGWTLGAPAELEAVAHSLWSKQWVAFRRWPGYARQPIKDYLPTGKK